MREDPIIYEDWKPGVFSKKILKPLIQIDSISSLLICLLFIIEGLILKSAFLIFTFVFMAVILFITEYILDQYSRDFNNRLIVLAIFLFLTYYLTLSFPSDRFYLFDIISGALFVIKIALIPIINSSMQVTGEMLIPKTELSEEKLLTQQKMLSVTDYAISTEKILSQQFNLAKSIFNPFIIAFIPIMFLELLLLIVQSRYQIIILLIMNLILLVSGIAFASLFTIWILERRKMRNAVKISNSKSLS